MRDESAITYYSRFTVVTEQREAWALDAGFRSYAFDGMRFWRRRRHSTRYEIVPRWKTPTHGWMHAAGCDCHLCTRAADAVERVA